jgi:DNA invertase Pin-like site-specific DNA recombinase
MAERNRAVRLYRTAQNMKAIAYIRFSTDEQASGTTVERQAENITVYSERNALEITETLIDDGFSASKGEHLSRGKLGRFLKEADKGTYKGFALVVERLDRLSRLGIQQTGALLQRLLEAGLKIHITEENRVISSLDDMLTAIMNAVRSFADQEYSKKLSERITRAWVSKKEAAVASHTPFGKRLPVWLAIEGQVKAGNKIIDHGKIVEVPEKVALVQEIFRLASLGVGSENICRELNGRALTRAWVVTTLSNRAVLGEFQPGKTGEVIQGYFPQIISQSQFDAVRQQANAKRKNGNYAGGNKQSSASGANLFSGLLFDITDPAHVRPIYFQEVKRAAYVMSAFDSEIKSNRMRYDKLESSILDFLSKTDWTAIAAKSESDEYKAAKAALEVTLRELDNATRRIDVADAAMEKDDINVATFTQMSVTLAKYKSLQSTLTEQKRALEASVQSAQTKSGALDKPDDLLTTDRLKLRVAIQQRLSQIDVVFFPNRHGFGLIFHYSNGVLQGLVRSRQGVAEVEIHLDEPEGGYEMLKTQIFDLARRYA